MDAALRAFAREVAAPDPEIDLARAALLIAAVEHPSLRPEEPLHALEDLAAMSGAKRADDELHRLHRLREFLFEEEGFRGNDADYYDPRNSCLNDVLARRLGIPITLALVLIEVGRRVGLEIAGIGLPGHFIVGARVGGDKILLDPFHGGAMLTRDACVDLVAQAVGRRMALRAEHFAPVTRRQLLIRMLNNLKANYSKRQEWPKLLAVIERLLVADDTSAAEVRDRGTVRITLGDYAGGLADWERYLTRCPEAPDAEALRGQLRRVRLKLASLN